MYRCGYVLQGAVIGNQVRILGDPVTVIVFLLKSGTYRFEIRKHELPKKVPDIFCAVYI